MAVIDPPSDFTSKPYACAKPCTKRFARHHDLLRHYKVHLTGDDRAKELIYCPFSGCNSCDFQRSNIKAHIKARHRRHNHLVCLKCKNFWAAMDLTALAEHGTTVHGTIPLTPVLPATSEMRLFNTVSPYMIQSNIALNLPLPGAEIFCEFPEWITTMPSPAVPTSDTRDYKVNFNVDNVATRPSDCVVLRSPGSSTIEERVASNYCQAGGLRWSLPPEFSEDR
ncbi:hypothetical protein IW262DRAFT_1556837 [Armillaria fumosa]|nr:hypothetical protein IW262DRAFT_1556837 [Armillaria fumosa]